MDTLLVNLYGGPGSGKSTMAAGIFERLKWNKVNCELATEYAKDKTWEESFKALDNQVTVFGKQFQRIYRLYGKVEVIITDSPLINSIVYNKEFGEEFNTFVLAMVNKFNSVDYFIERCKDYNPKGRSQSLEEAKAIDEVTFKLLNDKGIDYTVVKGIKENVDVLANNILKLIEKK